MPTESPRPEGFDHDARTATEGVDRQSIESAFPVSLDRNTKVVFDRFNNDGSAQLEVQRRSVHVDFRPGRQSFFQWKPDGAYQLRQQGDMLVATPDRSVRQDQPLDEMMFGAYLALKLHVPVMVYRPGHLPQFAQPGATDAADTSAPADRAPVDSTERDITTTLGEESGASSDSGSSSFDGGSAD